MTRLDKKNLRKIVKDFFEDDVNDFQTKVIDLNSKNITYLDDDVFVQIDYQNVEKLDLSHNHLNFINARKFVGLPNIVELILNSNKLVEIDTPFECLLNLRFLDISENLIEKISLNAFKNLKFLSKLDLADNRLSRLSDGIFDGLIKLEKLELRNNKIEAIQKNVFSKLENLKILRLENNKLSILDDQVFEKLSRLEELSLQENNLKIIRESLFRNLTCLLELYLDGNRLETIEENSFVNLAKLKIFYLKNNKFSFLYDNIFEGLTCLESLKINYNNLTSINSVCFSKLKCLKTLGLTGNQIERVQGNAFFNLKRLKNLYFDNNKIAEVHDEAFNGLEILEELRLDINCLVSISSHVFTNLGSLKRLYLETNEIESLENDVFKNLTKIEKLVISNNKLKSINNNLLTGLNNLSLLDFKSNKIEFIQNEAFKGLVKLESLNLSSNRIIALDGRLLQDLCNLEYIDLSMNKIELIDNYLFKNLVKVCDLRLNNNNLELIHSNQFQNMSLLETINLGHNKIRSLRSYTFWNLEKVKDINLEENKIDTIESKVFGDLRKLEKLDLLNNKIQFIGNEAFINFENMNNLKEINLTGNDQIEFIDLITLTNLIKMDKSKINLYKKLRMKGVDFFPIGMNKITNEFVDELARLAFELNFTFLFAASILLKICIYLDSKFDKFDTYKKNLVIFFRKFSESTKFDGFNNEKLGFKKWYKHLIPFTHDYLKKNLVETDIFYESLLKSESQMFPILHEYTLEFENTILINYLKQNEFSKFEDLIKRFLVLSKEPVKSNSYFILVNCLFWTNDQNETIFNFILGNEIKSTSYCQKYLLDLLLSLKGIYLKKTSNEFLKLPTELEEIYKKNDLDIYMNLVLLKNTSKCLFYSVAKLQSSRTLSFLLKDKEQLKLLVDSSIENCIQESEDTITNNTIKEIIDKYLSLSIETRKPLYLSVKSIESLAERNDSYLFKIFLDNSQVLNEKDKIQLELFYKFKFNLRNSLNSCLNITMDKDNERIAELLIDKIIELEINDYENPIITYDTLSKMFEMKWWREIERLLTSFAPISSSSNSSNVLNHFFTLFQKESTQKLINKTASEKIEVVIQESGMKSYQESNENLNLNSDENLDLPISYLLENEEVINQNKNIYKQVSRTDVDNVSNANELNQINKRNAFNFLCLDFQGNKKNKDHVLMMIAKSGQENLIQHEVILRLVYLKWRYFPRFIYHSQTCMHLAFLFLFIIYILNVFGTENLVMSEKNQTDFANNSTNLKNEELEKKNLMSNSFVLVLTFLLLIYFITYEVSEAISEKFAYFLSIKNWLECLTYIFALIVLITIQFESYLEITSLLGSLSVLFGFIVLMLRLEKNSSFGAYVVAFRKCFAKTIKTLPFIILLFIGFIYSFIIRAKIGVNFIDSPNTIYIDSSSIAKMTNMIIGGYELDQLGLNNQSFLYKLINFFIYFLFLILMTIISVNMLTGIAVGELESVLKEAEIYNIQQRICYILRIQSIISQLQKRLNSLTKGPIFDISSVMIFKNDEKENEVSNFSFLEKVIGWFKKHSQSEVEFIESSQKGINEYLSEAEYNARVLKDFITNKMNENEYKVVQITEYLESQRIDQTKKIEDLTLTVSKLERHFLEQNETQLKKLEALNIQISEILNKLNEISKQ